MKTIIVSALLVAIAFAEPPPSHSYLPPPAASRSSSGFPQGGPGGQRFTTSLPQIIAARSLEGHRGTAGVPGNGFARSSAQGKFGNEEPGYDHNAGAFGRNGLDDVSSEPASYNFGYMVNDYQEGTDFGHHEERDENRAQGEYHVVLPDGRRQTVNYEADEHGFKPHISYEDSEDFARSGGYDSNAKNARAIHHGSDFNGAHGSHGNTGSNGY